MLSRLGLPLFLLPSFIDVYSSDKSSWETRLMFKVVSSRIRSLLCIKQSYVTDEWNSVSPSSLERRQFGGVIAFLKLRSQRNNIYGLID